MRNKRFGSEPFVVCLHDGMDGVAVRLAGFGTREEAIAYAEGRYGPQMKTPHGIDRIDIVDLNGDIAWTRFI